MPYQSVRRPPSTRHCQLARVVLSLSFVVYLASLLIAHPAQAAEPRPAFSMISQTGVRQITLEGDNKVVPDAKTTSRINSQSLAQFPNWLLQTSRPAWELALELFKAVASNPWDELDDSYRSHSPLRPDETELGRWQWDNTRWDYHVQFSDDYLSLGFSRRF